MVISVTVTVNLNHTADMKIPGAPPSLMGDDQRLSSIFGADGLQ